MTRRHVWLIAAAASVFALLWACASRRPSSSARSIPRPASASRHQPRLRGRPALVGPDAAGGRRVADRCGARPRDARRALLVAVGTALMPLCDDDGGLVIAIGVLAAGGAGMAGPARADVGRRRAGSRSKRGMATGIVNAGGSFGQFIFVPIAQLLTACAGWAGAIQRSALIVLLALPPPGCCAAGHAAAQAAAPASAAPDVDCARRSPTRSDDPSYLLLDRGLLRLRLSRRLHRHAPAGRGGALPAAARGRRLVAGDRSACSTSSAASRSAGRSAAGA